MSSGTPCWRTAQDPSLRFVISNTTEAGIAYAEESLQEGLCPNSFSGQGHGLVAGPLQSAGWNSVRRTGIPALRTDRSQRRQAARLCPCITPKRGKLPTEFIIWVRETQRLLQYAGRSHCARFFRLLKRKHCTRSSATRTPCWSLPSLSCSGWSKARRAIADELPLHKAGLDVVWDYRPATLPHA